MRHPVSGGGRRIHLYAAAAIWSMGSLKIGTRLASLSSTDDDDQPHNVMGSEEAKGEGRKNRLREYENGTANFPHAKVGKGQAYNTSAVKPSLAAYS